MRHGRSRRAQLVLAVVTLVIAAGAAAVVLLATGLASTKPVRLRANSIAVIDAKSGHPVGDVPLAFSPSDVDASGNEIWVLNWLGRTATAIDPGTLKVIQTVGVDGDPQSQYAIGNTDWVGVPGGVDVVDAQADSNNTTKISLWKPAGGSTQCYVFVTGDGRTVWVSEGTNVAVIDAASGNVLRKLHLPTPSGVPPSLTCYGLRYSDGVLLAIRGPDFSIGRVDLRSASYTPIATEPSLTPENFGGTSANWVAGFGSYWVGTWTTTKSGQATNLTRLDPTSGTATNKIASPKPTGVQPNNLPGFNNLAVDRASGVWALEGPPINALAQIDQTTSQITRTIPVHHTVCCPEVEGLSSRSSLGLGRSILIVGGSTLWCRASTALSSPAAPAAALVWPIWIFTDPSAHHWRSARPLASNTCSQRRRTPAASPALVPVPCASTSSTVSGAVARPRRRRARGLGLPLGDRRVDALRPPVRRRARRRGSRRRCGPRRARRRRGRLSANIAMPSPSIVPSAASENGRQSPVCDSAGVLLKHMYIRMSLIVSTPPVITRSAAPSASSLTRDRQRRERAAHAPRRPRSWCRRDRSGWRSGRRRRCRAARGT